MESSASRPANAAGPCESICSTLQDFLRRSPSIWTRADLVIDGSHFSLQLSGKAGQNLALVKPHPEVPPVLDGVLLGILDMDSLARLDFLSLMMTDPAVEQCGAHKLCSALGRAISHAKEVLMRHSIVASMD